MQIMGYIFIAVAAGANVASPEFTSPKCTVKFAGRYYATIDYGDRKVFLVGSNYPDATAERRLMSQLEDLKIPNGPNTCAEVQTTLASELARSEILDRQIRKDTATLTSINAETHLSEVGVELSPAEWRRKTEHFKSLDARIAAASAKCGAKFEGLLKAIRRRSFGPELAFADDHFGVSVRPYESLAARRRSFKDFAQKTTIDFDAQDGPLAKSPAFRAVAEALWAEREPSSAEIASLARHIGGIQDQTVKTIRHDLAIWQSRIRGAYLRDDAIVKNLRDTKGSIALIIGNRHVEDLAPKLVKECRTRSGLGVSGGGDETPAAR